MTPGPWTAKVGDMEATTTETICTRCGEAPATGDAAAYEYLPGYSRRVPYDAVAFPSDTWLDDYCEDCLLDHGVDDMMDDYCDGPDDY